MNDSAFRYFDPVLYDGYPERDPQVFIIYPRIDTAGLVERTEEALWFHVNDVLESGLPERTEWSIGFVETEWNHVQMTLYSFAAKNTDWWSWLTGVSRYEDGQLDDEQYVRAAHEMVVIGAEMQHRLGSSTWEEYLRTRPELPGGLELDEHWEWGGGMWIPAEHAPKPL